MQHSKTDTINMTPSESSLNIISLKETTTCHIKPLWKISRLSTEKKQTINTTTYGVLQKLKMRLLFSPQSTTKEQTILKSDLDIKINSLGIRMHANWCANPTYQQMN